MIHWRVRARCDWEDCFCVDVFDYHLDTTDIAEAASLIKTEISSNYTIFTLERMD